MPHYAALGGQVEIVRMLFEEGMDIKDFDVAVERCTPLHIAAKRGREEEVELLLQRRGGCHGTRRMGE